MSNIKEIVESTLKKLPDNTSYDDIIEAIQLQKAIDEGLAQVNNGETINHEEFMQEIYSIISESKEILHD